jgi:diguanylate cyclase (GGDEF)-like protein
MNDLRSAEEKLAALRQRFALSLPGRLDAIETALAGDASELERQFHTLAGTAGTFGFSVISALARLGEENHTEASVTTSMLAELRVVVAGMAEGMAEASPVIEAQPLQLVPAQMARILCLEDDPDQAAYVCAILESVNYETMVAHDAAEFERAVKRFRPDLLLLDVTLPDGNGLELATSLRRVAAHAALPIVFLTGRTSMQSRLEGIRAGGDDYLVKPVDRDLLLATIAGRLERAQSVRTLIDRDGLTQAVTRAAFIRSLEAVVDEHSGLPHCLVMMDIDHFKNINDRYGHPIGDRVLSLFGRFLRTNVRMDDVVGRCGGEEFGVLLAGVGQDECRMLIERLLDRFGRIPHTARDGERFYVNFSAGVAMFHEGEDAESWRQRADDALYAAKRAGRARVEAA